MSQNQNSNLEEQNKKFTTSSRRWMKLQLTTVGNGHLLRSSVTDQESERVAYNEPLTFHCQNQQLPFYQ